MNVMRLNTIYGSTILAAILVVPATTLATTYSEAVDGDLSGDRLAPTTLQLSPGSNTVSGTFGVSPIPGVADLDYLTVIVSPGSRLTQLTLLGLNQGGSNSFLGVQAGPIMTLAPTSFDPSPLLGWSHIFKNQEGTDLLPALALDSGLDAGSYTFWINETDTSATWSYELDFRVTTVPVPGALWMFMSAIGGLAVARRRTQRRPQTLVPGAFG
jgi:hypothetical protein